MHIAPARVVREALGAKSKPVYSLTFVRLLWTLEPTACPTGSGCAAQPGTTGEQRFDLRGRGWFGEQVALPSVTPKCTEVFLLTGGLDTFASGRQVQGSGQRYDTLDNRLILGVVAEPIHE